MKCYEARLWLLSAKSSEPLPHPVERHLEDCARCRAKRRILGRLDDRVRSLATPAGSATAKKRFLERLNNLPDQADSAASFPFVPDYAKTPQRHIGRFGWNLAIRCAAGFTAACLLIAVGWLIGRRDPVVQIVKVPAPVPMAQKPAETPSPKIVEKLPPPTMVVEKSDHLALLVRILKHNGKLAESFDAAEQVNVLASLADDLKIELLDSVRREAFDDGLVLAELYAAVVRGGMISRLDRLPHDARKALPAKLGESFQSAAKEMAAKGKLANPAARELLAAAASTAREAADVLSGRPRTMAPNTERLDNSAGSILQTVVYKGLAIAAEPNPLERASLCSDATARIAPSVILLSAGAAPGEADALGNGLGEWFDRGVAANLEAIDRGNAAAREEAEKVRAQAAKTFEAMEADFDKAPPGAKDNVKRVIDASAPGWERAAFPGKGKGKGPPWRRGDDKMKQPGPPKKASLDGRIREVSLQCLEQDFRFAAAGVVALAARRREVVGVADLEASFLQEVVDRLG